jgi:chorismate mutase
MPGVADLSNHRTDAAQSPVRTAFANLDGRPLFSVTDPERDGAHDARHERPAAMTHGGGEGPTADSVELLAVRAEIERVDEAIVFLIDQRMRLARRVGELKRSVGLGVLDSRREAAVVDRAGALARDRGLDDDAVRDVFWRLIEMARGAQRERGRGD